MAIAISSASQSSLSIQLPHFEGPLDLLLYLIRKEEMDIMDIEIHKITTQYLDYIKMIKELNLEVAGEFIAVAASLIQIKSKMLLPQYDENGEVVENEDPRRELVQRLLEYQKYQEAAKMLYERPLLGRDVWTRGIREDFESERIQKDKESVVVDENPVFSLITAYRKVLKGAKNKVHKVAAKLQSIASRIREIRERLQVGVRIPMHELILADGVQDRDPRKNLLITFLSLLELGKLGFVSLFQTESFSEIYIEARKAIVEEALSNVEEYDTVREINVSKYEEAAEEEFENSLISVPSNEENQFAESQGVIASDEEIQEAELMMLENTTGENHEQNA